MFRLVSLLPITRQINWKLYAPVKLYDKYCQFSMEDLCFSIIDRRIHNWKNTYFGFALVAFSFYSMTSPFVLKWLLAVQALKCWRSLLSVKIVTGFQIILASNTLWTHFSTIYACTMRFEHEEFTCFFFQLFIKVPHTVNRCSLAVPVEGCFSFQSLIVPITPNLCNKTFSWYHKCSGAINSSSRILFGFSDSKRRT